MKILFYFLFLSLIQFIHSYKIKSTFKHKIRHRNKNNLVPIRFTGTQNPDKEREELLKTFNNVIIGPHICPEIIPKKNPCHGERKNEQLREIRMLKDAAAYFFDQTDYFLLNYFEDDVREAYETFWENNQKKHKDKDSQKSFEEGIFQDGIDWISLNTTIPECEWLDADKFNIDKLMNDYDIDHCEDNQKSEVLQFQEFIYLVIMETIKIPADHDCFACFQITKQEIKKFFDLIDCNQDGRINSYEIFKAMEKMQNLPYEVTTTTMINSFVMNTMEFKSASLDIIDFNHGLLIGMFEGVVSPTKMNEIALNSMKVLRRKIWDKGQGPA